MNRARFASICGVACGALALLTTVIGGAAYPGYRHLTQYISELGAREAPHALWINAAGFLPIGLLGIACLIALRPSLSPNRIAAAGWWLLSGLPLAYVLAAVAPCDAGCPAEGSASQSLHNLTGILEYLLAPGGLLLIAGGFAAARARRMAALAALTAVTVLVVFIALSSGTALRGLWQRVAELALFGWLAWAGLTGART